MLKCRELAERASDYVDDQLPLRQRLAVMLHLLMCGRCRGFIRHLRLTIAYCRSLQAHACEEHEAEVIARRAIEAARQES